MDFYDIIPIDFHIFLRGRYITNQDLTTLPTMLYHCLNHITYVIYVVVYNSLGGYLHIYIYVDMYIYIYACMYLYTLYITSYTYIPSSNPVVSLFAAEVPGRRGCIQILSARTEAWSCTRKAIEWPWKKWKIWGKSW